MSAAVPAPLFSVIVPVYRAEAFLVRCADSLSAQSYPYLDIILVDDGSPDNSGALCDTLAAKDMRIRVIHQPNSGASAARNRGIEAARGDFLCFVDADDYVDENHIANFVRGLGDEVDMVFQGICEIRNGTETRKIPHPKRYTQADLCEAIADINTQSMFGYVCNKCYRRSIIEEHQLRFRTDISLSEDRLFALEYMPYVRSLQLTDGCSYYYELQSNGLTLRHRTYEEMKAAADANLQAALHLLSLSPSERFLRDTRRMYAMCATGFLNALFRDGYSHRAVSTALADFKAKANAWLALYQPIATDQKVLCKALKLPSFLCIPLMRCYWFIKKTKHEISA